MNINFRKVRWKNLLSTGNIFTEVVLDSHRTTLISGENGAGKSTIIEAIVFALYGKAFRKINKPQLLNSINQKDLLVEVEFDIGSSHYLVRRGIKPTVFDIECNGKLIDKTGDQQEHLENNIIKVKYKSFTQVVVLGSATYIPFMELPTPNRREVVEDLLDIQIFSTMNLLLKDKVSATKSSIEETKYKIDSANSRLQSAKENSQSIQEIREVEVEKIKQRMREHLEFIESETASLNEVTVSIEAHMSKIEDAADVRQKRDSIRDIKTELSLKMKAIDHDLLFYHDRDDCPTCKQAIAEDFKRETLKQKQEQKQELAQASDKLSARIEKFDSRLVDIQQIQTTIQQLQTKAGESRATINVSKNILKTSKRELEEAQQEVLAVDTSKVEQTEIELAQVLKDQQELMQERETLAVVATMLKDGGIKTRIIRQYIPVMNKLINKYLALFDLFVDFQLDESFNEVIKSRHRDAFTYSSFSEGEKMRINLALLLTWRAIAKMRNSVSTNLLILDETLDGSMDGIGIDSLIDALHNADGGDNVFVISHRGELFGEKFGRHLKFEKVKNFSRLAA